MRQYTYVSHHEVEVHDKMRIEFNARTSMHCRGVHTLPASITLLHAPSEAPERDAHRRSMNEAAPERARSDELERQTNQFQPMHKAARRFPVAGTSAADIDAMLSAKQLSARLFFRWK